MFVNELFEDDMFSDRKRMPPKNLNLLLQWAGNDPERKYFKWVADFGLKHGMNLQQTLEVLQYFDDDYYNDEYGIDDRTATALFNAYENIYDAWVPHDFSHDEPTTVTWADETPGGNLQ